MPNTAPKFSKVEILLRNTNASSIQAVDREEFLDCGLIITGNYLIIVIDENDIKNSLTSTGKIFNLDKIISYKTHGQ